MKKDLILYNYIEVKQSGKRCQIYFIMLKKIVICDKDNAIGMKRGRSNKNRNLQCFHYACTLSFAFVFYLPDVIISIAFFKSFLPSLLSSQSCCVCKARQSHSAKKIRSLSARFSSNLSLLASSSLW